VDAHKKTHAAVAVDAATGKVVGQLTVKAVDDGHDRLVRWARGLDAERRFAIEDCRHVSGRLERHLIARGERAVRVPPKMMAGMRRAARTRGKSDPIDATAVAQAALRAPELPEARLADEELELRLLVDHRERLVSRRSQAQSRLRWHLHDLDPTIEVPLRALDRLVWLRRVEKRLAAMGDGVRVRLARELLAEIIDLTRKANAYEREIAALAKMGAAALLELPGCGALTTAKLVGEIGGVARFDSEAKLAAHAGVAPLEASSGSRRRHRLSRAGNRQVNAALHRIAITQKRIHEPARLFLKKKVSEGKTDREALRSLKRHLVRVVYNAMQSMDVERVGSEKLAPPLLT
jgi:transposase